VTFKKREITGEGGSDVWRRMEGEFELYSDLRNGELRRWMTEELRVDYHDPERGEALSDCGLTTSSVDLT